MKNSKKIQKFKKFGKIEKIQKFWNLWKNRKFGKILKLVKNWNEFCPDPVQTRIWFWSGPESGLQTKSRFQSGSKEFQTLDEIWTCTDDGQLWSEMDYSVNIHTILKIIAVRDPLSRLYSAWKDKSRTFRFQNGSIDWEQIKNGTTWTWGITNDIRARNVMKNVLEQHDYNFNPRHFGIDQFED